MKKLFLLFTIVFCLGAIANAQSRGTIVFVSYRDSVKIDPVTNEPPDMPHIYALQEAGYNVITFYNASLSTASQETKDTLLNANLIVMGRSTPSTDYSGDNKTAWNSLTTPILNLELWNCRSSRLNWFNTTNMGGNPDTAAGITNAAIVETGDPVFDGVNVGDPVPWIHGAYDAVGTTDPGYGTLMAKLASDNTVLFVRFEPDVEFYPGSVDLPLGPRTVIGNGRDNSGKAPFTYFNFTPESKEVFLKEVARMVALGGGGTGIKNRDNLTLPSTPELLANYPNPFNPTTKIVYALPHQSNVKLEVFNVLGRKVATLVNGTKSSGRHAEVFDASNLASGVYVYKLSTPTSVMAKKMILMK